MVAEKLNSVMPYWDRSIDIVIATHGDSDHIKGLVSVLEHYDVDMIIWNGAKAETDIFEEFERAMNNEGASIVEGKCCMRFNLGENSFFEILYPLPQPEQDRVATKVKQNDLSVVVRFVYGDTSILFTGDIERQVEYEIVSQGLNLKSDILKVAHHGSKTSSSQLFLEAVRPGAAVISAGRNNSYGHPHEVVLQNLEKYNIMVRRTDKEGDVLLVIESHL